MRHTCDKPVNMNGTDEIHWKVIVVLKFLKTTQDDLLNILLQ